MTNPFKEYVPSTSRFSFLKHSELLACPTKTSDAANRLPGKGSVVSSGIRSQQQKPPVPAFCEQAYTQGHFFYGLKVAMPMGPGRQFSQFV